MLSGIKKKAWKSLMKAILYKAIDDLDDPKNRDEAIWFAHTQWARELCEETGTDYKSYLTKFEK